MAKSDPLTGLMNRQSYYQDMETLDGSITGTASIDMNELKYLNDTFGHSAGDEALKTVSKCLLDNRIKGELIYRVGGDEFIILYTGSTEEEIVKNLEAMKATLAKTNYTCAFGYSMKEKGESVEAAVLRADKEMYYDKSAQKRAVLERGGRLHRRKDD